jgi:hypothetical protein
VKLAQKQSATSDFCGATLAPCSKRETMCRHRTFSPTPGMPDGVRFLDPLSSLLRRHNRGRPRIGPHNFVSDVGLSFLYLLEVIVDSSHYFWSNQTVSAHQDVLLVWIWIRISELDRFDVNCCWKLVEQLSTTRCHSGKFHIIYGTLFGLTTLLPAHDQFSFCVIVVPLRGRSDHEASDTL